MNEKKRSMQLSMEDAQQKMIFEVLPKMADYYDELKHGSLEEARQRLRYQIGEGWVQRTVDLIGSERLKRIRPFWYLTFVEGEDGAIGSDNMSKNVDTFMSPESAIMEIAFYLAMNESHMYEYYLNIPVDFDSVNLTVMTGEAGPNQHVHLVESLQQEVSTGEFYQLLGKQRELMIKIGVAIREQLRGS
ncbi:MAG: hypothetical protein ACXVP2_06475, partial [Tumebacillaceae bacterium]